MELAVAPALPPKQPASRSEEDLPSLSPTARAWFTAADLDDLCEELEQELGSDAASSCCDVADELEAPLPGLPLFARPGQSLREAVRHTAVDLDDLCSEELADDGEGRSSSSTLPPPGGSQTTSPAGDTDVDSPGDWDATFTAGAGRPAWWQASGPRAGAPPGGSDVLLSAYFGALYLRGELFPGGHGYRAARTRGHSVELLEWAGDDDLVTIWAHALDLRPLCGDGRLLVLHGCMLDDARTESDVYVYLSQVHSLYHCALGQAV